MFVALSDLLIEMQVLIFFILLFLVSCHTISNHGALVISIGLCSKIKVMMIKEKWFTL
ncbi:hypothetical protein [Wolbachia endosymbiont of Litomosoides sigmodontis]|uniref:hypothetical protein n=1 Tax=Wolbachia endosymbiont of Litomosoides sigmodontis TaxID=80850 RepID=UPI001FE9506A|nr:hypothetical protein [Wolbachia endosymbiont of Litomosoides sigmodontis]